MSNSSPQLLSVCDADRSHNRSRKKLIRPSVLTSFLEYLFPLILNSRLDKVVKNVKSIHGLIFLCVEIMLSKVPICTGAKWEAIFNVVGKFLKELTESDDKEGLRVGLQGVEMLCGKRGYSSHASNGTLERVISLCVGCLLVVGDKAKKWRNANVARGEGGGVDEEIMRGVGIAAQHLGAFSVANDVLVLRVFSDDPTKYADGTSRLGRASTMSGGGGSGAPDLLGLADEDRNRERFDSSTTYEDTDESVPPHTMHRKLWGDFIVCLEDSSTRNVRVAGEYLWGLEVEMECLKGLIWLAMVPSEGVRGGGGGEGRRRRRARICG